MQNDVNFRIRSAHMTDPDCQDQGTMPQRGKVAKGNSWTKDDFFCYILRMIFYFHKIKIVLFLVTEKRVFVSMAGLYLNSYTSSELTRNAIVYLFTLSHLCLWPAVKRRVSR